MPSGTAICPEVQALAIIIAAVYVVVNLVADVLTIVVTPRARTGGDRSMHSRGDDPST